MNWAVLAVVSVVTVSVATLLERVLLKDDESDPISYAIVFQFLLGMVVLAWALMLGKFVWPTWSWSTAVHFLISGLLWAGSTTFGFQAMKRLNAGEVTILSSSSAVVSIGLSIWLLGEVLSVNVVVGTVLVLLSIFLVNSEKLSFRSIEGIKFALLAAACAGVAVVNDAYVLNTYEVFSYVALMSFLPGMVLMVFFPRKLLSAKSVVVSKTMKLMVVFTLLYAVQAVTYYLAYDYGAPISHLSPITKSSIVLTVVLGILFLNERDNMARKIVAAVVVTGGVLLLG